MHDFLEIPSYCVQEENETDSPYSSDLTLVHKRYFAHWRKLTPDVLDEPHETLVNTSQLLISTVFLHILGL